MQEFDQRQFRDALAQFATGVTIITAAGRDGPVGMTVNSFSSVSLDPPLILWSIAKDSDRFSAFEQSPYFCVHVLRAEDEALAMRFAANGIDFSGLAFGLGSGDIPLLAGFAARFECRVAARHEGGDHVILVGEVERIDHEKAQPLVFHGGRFGQFAAC
ncbi:MAG: flavin reductase family protein [Pseudomonadota bacterium]